MPNIHAKHRSQELEYINLGISDLETDSKFTHWWNSHFSEVNYFKEDEQKLLKLAAVLVGQRASVCATASILDDLYKIIDQQAFLKESFEKQMGMETGVPAIEKTATEPKLAIFKLVKQFLFLNPEQLLIWYGSFRQMFCGAPGSGKTILLQHKALECLKNRNLWWYCTTSTGLIV